MRLHWRSLILLACLLPSSILAAGQEQLPFRTAVELALKNSAASGIARSDLQRAHAAVDQVHDFFLPNMVFGSGLGASYGFPLSLEGAAPAIFNINYQEGLLNLAQRENVKAAKADVQVTAAQNADRRNEVIMETALSYIQLDILDGSINVQREQQEAAAKYQDIANQRVQAGLDSKVELTRAKLAVARTKLDIAQAQAAAEQLRLRLSQLTGLPVSSIKTSTESIPRLPEVSQDQDLAAQAAQDNPAV